MTDSKPDSVGPAPGSPQPEANKGRAVRRRWLAALVGVGIFIAAAVAICFFLLGRWDRDRALSLARQGGFAAAQPLLTSAAERDPADVDVVEALARGYLEAGDASRATPWLSRWCSLRPQQTEPAELRFQVALRLGQPEEAVAAGRHLLTLDPTNHKVRTQVALQCQSLGRLDEAEQECRRCLQDAPDDPAALVLLARVLQQKGDRAAAEAIVDGLLTRDVRSGEVVMLRAVLHLDADQPDKAIPLLRQLVDGWPGQKRFALYQLVVALKRAGENEEAARQEALLHQLQEVEVLLLDSNSNPHHLPLRVRAAEALLEVGRDREAVALLQAALERDPHFSDAHRLLAAWYEKGGQPEKAARHRRLAGDSRAGGSP
jgi:predicted Zn-dependent protease